MKKMFYVGILLLLFGESATKTSDDKIIIKIGHINSASQVGVREAEAALKYAIKEIHRLQLINNSVDFQ